MNQIIKKQHSSLPLINKYLLLFHSLTYEHIFDFPQVKNSSASATPDIILELAFTSFELKKIRDKFLNVINIMCNEGLWLSLKMYGVNPSMYLFLYLNSLFEIKGIWLLLMRHSIK